MDVPGHHGRRIFHIFHIFNTPPPARSGLAARLGWRTSCSIQADTLLLASEHGRYCLQAGRILDGYARRSEVRDQDIILAAIRVDLRERAREGVIELNRTELTHRFAANPQRRGVLALSLLYAEVLPDLIRRGLARELPKRGKLQAYHFAMIDP